MPAPSASRLTAEEIAELLARGDTFLLVGDVTSARLFYERAADAGDRQAAMRMAASFDPTFLSRAGLRGPRGDPDKAQSWYRRAFDISVPEADRQAKNLETK
jgi:TPR repeat protein